jgi:copper chaperone CopZ
MKENEMTTTSEFQVTGMTCGHCEMAIRSEVAQIPGVDGIDVSAQTGKLVVSSASPVDDAAILAAVDEAGYEAVRI